MADKDIIERVRQAFQLSQNTYLEKTQLNLL
jgi:hypothetical protein